MSQRCNRRGSYMQLAGPVARPDAVRMTMAVPVSGVGFPTINPTRRHWPITRRDLP